MAGATGGIRIKGAKELEAAFLNLRREVLRDLKPALLAAAEHIRVDAQDRSVADISNIGPRWSRMRIGATPHILYVAPKSHRRGGSPRKNLAPLLAVAMTEAAEAGEDEAFAAVEAVVEVDIARNGFT